LCSNIFLFLIPDNPIYLYKLFFFIFPNEITFIITKVGAKKICLNPENKKFYEVKEC
jgi:hypothetical protein